MLADLKKEWLRIMHDRGWDQNNHYHEWILSRLPANVGYAIDIGCGKGEFARRLSLTAHHVDAIDCDATILAEARMKSPEGRNISYLEGDFHEIELSPETYDAVVSIASIHHMRVSAALEKMKRILKPGGTLVILGLYRDSNVIDFFWSVISKILDTIVKFCFFRKTHEPIGNAMKTVDPKETFREVSSRAKSLLPNVKMHRHLYWRYSIVWTKYD